MPSFSLQPLLMQLPMAEAGQLLLVIGISFAVITLIASTSRFHTMIQLGEEELTSVENCNDFFFIQTTRYISKINRISDGFIILIAQFRTDQADKRPVQEQMLLGLRKKIREDTDKACLFREDCVAAILDADEDKVEAITKRLAEDLKQLASNLPEVSAVRAGASIFPLHGQRSQQLVDVATEALEQVDFEQKLPLGIAPAPELDEQEEEVAEKTDLSGEPGELTKKDQHAALDPLTGVLKPEAVGSYMRKYLLEIRRKKDPAAVLCIGINQIENIINLHGEAAADAVISGVSKLIQKLTRDSDLIGRYHRDDFLVLAPCSLEQGEMISVRIREAVQKEIFLFEGKRIKSSVAIGISAHPEHGRTLRDLFRGAYAALETIHEWNTSSCLVYDPAQHDKKGKHASTT